MTFSTTFILLLGKRPSFKERILVQDVFTQFPTRDLHALIRHIIIVTFLIEGIGALILFLRWSQDFPLLQAAYYAIFHAISAFCNAGFSLFFNSFINYQTDWIINLVLTSLIVLGGLGFLTLMEVKKILIGKPGPKKKISLHTKIVLSVTFLLLGFGTLIIFFLEQENTLQGLSVSDKILVSYFQAVTPRTAGFNSVDYSLMTNGTLFFTMILMFIGASPGSTGGGIKTGTTGTLLAMVRAWLAGRDRASLFKRTLPRETTIKALSVVVVCATIIFFFTALLLITELRAVSYIHSQDRFLEIFFEVVSAFGTVGLSIGATPKLTFLGKLLVTFLMFMGRLGPLTIALAIARKEAKGIYEYPEENVMIG